MGKRRRGADLRAVVVASVAAMALITSAGPVNASAGTAPARTAAPTARWPQFMGRPSHVGVNPYEHDLSVDNVSELALDWVGLVPGDLNWTSPVVAKGKAYIAGGDAGLVVFDADGCGQPTCQPIWVGQTGPQAIATPALAGGFAYVPSQASFTSNDGRLNVFDARGCGAPTCRPVWTGIGGTESFLVSSPAVAGGVVYVGDTDGMLSAFPAGGCGSPACAPLWQGETGGSIDIASPTVAGGVVLVSGGDFLFAFGASGCGDPVCQPLWKGPAELMSNTPAVFDGVVYVDAQPFLQGGRSIGVIAAFDLDGCGAATCQPLWSGINFSTGFESSPVVANGVVYIGKGPATFLDAGIFAYDAAGCGKAICEPISFVQTGPEQQFYLASTPAVVDGVVYMGSTESEGQAGLYVFDRP